MDLAALCFVGSCPTSWWAVVEVLMLVSHRGLGQMILRRNPISQSSHKPGSAEKWIVHFSRNQRLGQRCLKNEQFSARRLPDSGQVSRNSVSSTTLARCPSAPPRTAAGQVRTGDSRFGEGPAFKLQPCA